MDTRQPHTRPGTARGHVSRVRRRKGAHRATTAAAWVRPATVRDLASGDRQATSAALLAVTSDTLMRGRLDAGGTRLRLRALHVMGHGSARIARAIGASEQAIQKIPRGQTATVRPGLRDAGAALHGAWGDKPATG